MPRTPPVCSFSEAFVPLGYRGIRFRTPSSTANKAERADINRQAEHILDIYGSSILRFAYSYLHNMSDIEEVLQDALVQFLKTAAAFALPRLAGPNPPDTVMTTPDITEVSSAGELEALVGFEIEKVDLPFDVEAVTYTSYWRELAQVTYTGEGQTAVFRKTLGSADPSGDYNVYAEEKALETDGISANLKGEDGLYTLAVWSDGEYSYSLDITDGLTEDAWLELINGIK